MQKLLLSIVTLVLLVLPVDVLATMPAEPKFTDVEIGSSYYNAIYYLRNRGVVQGYEDDSFKPIRAVSRAEFLKMILRAAERNVVTQVASKPFPDVVTTAWYAPYIKTAVDTGIISGYPDGKFYPDQTVSRIEAIKMLLKANYIGDRDLTNNDSYSDVPLHVWYRPYAYYAKSNQLVDTYPGNLLKPDEALNRGQTADLIFRLYQKKPELAADTRDVPSLNAVDSARILLTPTNINDYSGDRAAATACNEQFNDSNPTAEIEFSDSNMGVKFLIPYNVLWGNETFRINPYDYENGQLLFGPLKQGRDCNWVRAFSLDFLNVKPAVQIIPPLQDKEEIKGLQRISINNIWMITYTESIPECNKFNAIVLGEKKNYQLAVCGTWEDAQPILQTFQLVDATTFRSEH